MKLELHILQNFVPSNLNRDDSGNPKDCEFGGFRRARVSSQCLKRRIRQTNAFKSRFANDEKHKSYRTLRANEILTGKLSAKYDLPQDQAQIIGEALLSVVLGKFDKNESKVLFYTCDSELEKIAETINILSTEKDNYIGDLKDNVGAANDGNEKTAKKAQDKIDAIASKIIAQYMKTSGSVTEAADIALFGRMLASAPTMNIDAACQVAHAVSTNKITMDFDYFTALDDLKLEADEQGAGHINATAFNSSCFYRYSCIDSKILLDNLSQDAELTKLSILAFVEGAIEAIPTGKINTFGNNNPPQFVLCTVTEDSSPASLANAFEKPVSPKADKSLTEMSVEKLDSYFDDMNKAYGRNYSLQTCFGIGELPLKSLANNRTESIDGFIEQIGNFLNEKIK